MNVFRLIDFLFGLVSVDGELAFIIGTQNSVQWSEGAGLGQNPSVSYSAGPKTSVVELICSTDETNTLEALGEGPPEIYKFRLTTKCACWNGCKGKEIQNNLPMMQDKNKESFFCIVKILIGVTI